MDLFESLAHIMNEDADSDVENLSICGHSPGILRRRRRAFGELHDIFRRFSTYDIETSLSSSSGLSRFIEKNEMRMKPNEETVKPETLLDIAAKVAAQHFSAADFEACQPPLDEALWKKVAYWAFPQSMEQVCSMATIGCGQPKVLPGSCGPPIHYERSENLQWRRGVDLALEGKIREISQVGFMMTAQIRKNEPKAPSSLSEELTSPGSQDSCGDIRVALTFELQQITSSSCSECKDCLWCPHINAAIVYRICRSNQVTTHAPMTEILSTLSREQLQKLVQYAIQEDPAGILGQVFRHINTLRDPTSEMSSVSGAPDPTLGTILGGGDNQWDRSVKLMLKEFAAGLKELRNVRLSMHEHTDVYPDSYDWTDKIDSKMYSFIKRALQLHRVGDNNHATILITMLELTVVGTSLLEAGSHAPYARFLHDFMNVVGLFLLSPRLERRTRNCIHHRLVKLSNHDRIWKEDLPTSTWSERPPPSTVIQKHAAQVQLYESHLLADVFAAFCVPTMPSGLTDLLSGRVSLENCDYDESIVIMLARLDSLYQESMKNKFDSVARFLPLVLKRLVTACIKHSIFSEADLGLLDNSAMVAFLQSFGVSSLYNCAPILRFKGKSKRSVGKGKGPAKRSRKSRGGEEAELTESQLCYSLLHVLHLASASHKIVEKTYISPELEMFANLLALELSRLRTVVKKGELQNSEQNWLFNLECSAVKSIDRLVQNSNDGMVVLDTYLKVINQVGLDFYELKYPLTLLETICKVGRDSISLYGTSEDILVQRWRLVDMCATVLKNASESIKEYTLPSHAGLNLIAHLFDVGRELTVRQKHEAHKQFVHKRFHAIASTFFSLVRLKRPNELKLLTQALTALAKVDHFIVLRLISQDVRGCGAKIEGIQEAMEACLKFSLHAYQTIKEASLAGSSTFGDLDRTFIFSLVYKLGIGSLKHFADMWHKFLTVRDMVDLLDLLQPQIKAEDTFPSEVTTLVLPYLATDQPHSEETHTLIKVFTPGDDNYNEALQLVLDKPHNFSHSTLFELALNHDVFISGPWPKQEQNAAVSSQISFKFLPLLFAYVPADLTWQSEISSQVLSLALAGLKSTTQRDTAQPGAGQLALEYVEWITLRVISGHSGHTLRQLMHHTAFQQLMTCLCENCNQDPDILQRVFQTLQRKVSHIRSPVLNPLKTALIEAYRYNFITLAGTVTSAGYSNIVTQLVRAREHCKRYFRQNEGVKVFEDEVVASLRKAHNGKKKLQKMIKDEFGNL